MQIVFVFLVFFLISTGGFCGELPKKASSKKAAPSTKASSAPAKYSTAKLDLLTDKLSSEYLGQSVEDIFHAYQKRVKNQKDEFETSADFERRVAALEQEPLVGNIKSYDCLAYAVTPIEIKFYDAPGKGEIGIVKTHEKEVLARYDAESGIITVKPSWVDCYYATWPKASCIATVREYYRFPPYIAQNAMGATMTVTYSKIFSYGVLFRDANADDFTISISMPPEKAKALKNNLGLLVLYKLTEPYIKSDYNVITPTFSDPRKTEELSSHLIANVVEVWLYNFKTGEIYRKQKKNKHS